MWGHLRVLEAVDHGAFGEVYRAWDTRLDREVALKLLPPDSGGAPPASSIIEEGRLLARVRHPNVVTLYGAERIGGRIGLWMEFVRGRTLEQLLRSGAVFSADEVRRLGLELCAAVSAVHAAGLLHRDIKAQNVMVADDGRLVLMDFGTGQELGDVSAGRLAGTPLYLAPEVLAGGPPTVGSDLYSVGVLLFHLLTGAYPVRATTLAELRRAHDLGNRVDLLTLRAEVPKGLARVIARAIDPRPRGRFNSANALAASLVALARPGRVVRAAPLVGGVLILMLLAWGGGVLLRPVEGDPRSVVSSMPTAAAPVLSLPGETLQLALSPDGTQIAFVWAPALEANLYVNRLGTEDVVQLTHAPASGSFPAWSPDGRSIAFKHRAAGASDRHAISVVPAGGGPHRTVWSGDLILGRGLDWSPDGAYLVSSVRTRGKREHRILRISVHTGESDWLTSATDGSDDCYPVFSPDGRAIAFVRNSGPAPGIYLYRDDTREVERLMTMKSAVKRLAWSPGHDLFFASEEGPGNDRLWNMRVPGGQVEPVAGTGPGASQPSVAKSVERLVFLQETLDRNLYRARLDAPSQSRVEQLPGTIRSETHPDLSPDGSSLAFVSDRTGYSEIWTANPRGADAKPVTSLKTITRHPRWAPDGGRLAFVGLAAGANNHDIYLVPASGGGVRRLTYEPSTEQWPTWSRDGKWIYFTSDRSGTWEIWKVPDAGGPAIQVTTTGALKAWESRDGGLLLYADLDGGLWRMPVAGGRAERVLDFPRATHWGGEWVPVENGIVLLNTGAARQSTLELFDFSTGRLRSLLTLPGLYDNGSGFTITGDGKWVVYAQRDVARTEIMAMGADR